MRLIHTKTLVLKEFFDNAIPDYVILSHTWGNEEVTFSKMQNGKAIYKEGYQKIKLCCNQALLDGFDYAWVDTCCIDKSSSAELSEAINSMFRWYKSADLCYVYIQDFEADLEGLQDPNSASSQAFANCRWFTRGWTLQELIAPSDVYFFDESWINFGTKTSLLLTLSAITGIDHIVLSQRDYQLNQLPVAKRMSWASRRQTTRLEDAAYSLLGMFDVNMPLLYGEGKKAFTRLLEEIIKISDDHSVFAWCTPIRSDGSEPEQPTGLLASSPAYYSKMGNIVCNRSWGHSIPYSMTNKGLSITLETLKNNFLDSHDLLCILRCWEGNESWQRICVRVRCVEGDQYCRVESYRTYMTWSPDLLSKKSNIETVHMYIASTFQAPSSRDVVRAGGGTCALNFKLFRNSDAVQNSVDKHNVSRSGVRSSGDHSVQSTKSTKAPLLEVVLGFVHLVGFPTARWDATSNVLAAPHGLLIPGIVLKKVEGFYVVIAVGFHQYGQEAWCLHRLVPDSIGSREVGNLYDEISSDNEEALRLRGWSAVISTDDVRVRTTINRKPTHLCANYDVDIYIDEFKRREVAESQGHPGSLFTRMVSTGTVVDEESSLSFSDLESRPRSNRNRPLK